MAAKSPPRNKETATKGRTLTEKDPQAQLAVGERDKINVEVSWTVKAMSGAAHHPLQRSSSFSGEVDMDASCLLFNKWGRFVETIFWDNLSSEGVRHLGPPLVHNPSSSSSLIR